VARAVGLEGFDRRRIGFPWYAKQVEDIDAIEQVDAYTSGRRQQRQLEVPVGRRHQHIAISAQCGCSQVAARGQARQRRRRGGRRRADGRIDM